MIRHALDQAADDVDWKAFTDEVMSKVTPQKLPFVERLKLTVSEMVLYQRRQMMAAFAGAVAAIAVTVPVILKLTANTPDGYANSKLEVQTVSVEESAQVRPVVMETDQGDAIIWTLDAKDPRDPKPKDPTKTVTDDKVKPPGTEAGKKKKNKGEEGEEELITTPEKEGPL
jgi:anti-sigma factor RsiW